MIALSVTCQRGLEGVLAEELSQLGCGEIAPAYCAVQCTVPALADVYRLNYCLATAARVYLPLLQSPCHHPKDLYKAVRAFDWALWFSSGQTLAIDVKGNHPQFRNTLYAAQVVKDAICDELRLHKNGWRPSVDLKDPDLRFGLLLQGGQITLSFDSTNVPLYKRGYRVESGDAPLQESLAAGLLKIAGYEGLSSLFDPCCGSGTLLIEAALIATKTPPGFFRSDFGFMAHPQFLEADWAKVKTVADAVRQPLQKGIISGIDLDAGVLQSCHANLVRAGWAEQIAVEQGDFRHYTPKSPPPVVVTNPPHGKRLGQSEDLISLYRSLGDFFKQKMEHPGKAFVFTSDLFLARQVGLKPSKRHVLWASDLESRLLAFDVF